MDQNLLNFCVRRHSLSVSLGRETKFYNHTKPHVWLVFLCILQFPSSNCYKPNGNRFQDLVLSCYESDICFVSEFYARSQNCEKRRLPSSCPSAWNNSAPTRRILMKLSNWLFFRKSVAKIQVLLKSDKNNMYFIWRRFEIFLLYLAKFFLEWEMF